MKQTAACSRDDFFDRFLWDENTISRYADSLHYGPGLDIIRDFAAKGGRSLSILDAGCGSGAFHKILRHRHVEHEYTGCDISSTLLSRGKKFYGINRFVQCDIVDLPFQNNSFDVVAAYGIVYSIDAFEKVLKELMRVSRGVLIVNLLAPPLGWNSMRVKGILKDQYVWMLNPSHWKEYLDAYSIPAPDQTVTWQVPLNTQGDYPVYRGIPYRLEQTHVWRLQGQGQDRP